MRELQEQKSILAKLMASENISVRHAKVPTAGFDPKSRTLVLPILKEMEGEVYDLFVCHEVGHALYTPAEGWHKAVCENGPNYKGFLNIVEDARIEKLIKRKYHGAAKSMHAGYQVLMHERDFFGIKKFNIDISKRAVRYFMQVIDYNLKNMPYTTQLYFMKVQEIVSTNMDKSLV